MLRLRVPVTGDERRARIDEQVVNAETNRIEIVFPGKPAEAARAAAKARGFRHRQSAPGSHLNNGGVFAPGIP